MALASEVISFAYREANFNTVSGVPTTVEFAEGLTLLQPIVNALPGMVTNIRMKPWFIPAPQKVSAIAADYPAYSSDALAPQNIYNPPSNRRLMMRNTEDVDVFFQYQPQPGAIMEYVDTGHEGIVTLNGNASFFGLTGSNESVVINPEGAGGRNAPRRWHYRADFGGWQELTTLALTSTIPYPVEFDDYFITALAVRLSPRFGSEPRQVTILRFQQMEAYIRDQWLQAEEVLSGAHAQPTLQNWNDSYRGGGLG